MAEGKAPDEIAVSPQPIASLDSVFGLRLSYAGSVLYLLLLVLSDPLG
jgi:hypothetical protein